MTSTAPKKRSYEVAEYETWAETPDLRMVVLTLAAGQEVPWHWHSNVSDTFFCMQGPMVIETRAPRAVVELKPGETHVVPAKRAHRLRAGRARARDRHAQRVQEEGLRRAYRDGRECLEARLGDVLRQALGDGHRLSRRD